MINSTPLLLRLHQFFNIPIVGQLRREMAALTAADKEFFIEEFNRSGMPTEPETSAARTRPARTLTIKEAKPSCRSDSNACGNGSTRCARNKTADAFPLCAAADEKQRTVDQIL